MPYKDKEIALQYHREYNRTYMREDRQKDPEKYKQRDYKWRGSNPRKRLVTCTRQSSKLKNLDHNITEEDLLLPEYCPYTGIPIDYTAGNGKTMSKPSVDRIDPTKGYIKGNVELISSLANTMKNKASVLQLQRFAQEVLRRHPIVQS